MKADVEVTATYLSGAENLVFRYSSSAAYLKNGESAYSPWNVGR